MNDDQTLADRIINRIALFRELSLLATQIQLAFIHWKTFTHTEPNFDGDSIRLVYKQAGSECSYVISITKEEVSHE